MHYLTATIQIATATHSHNHTNLRRYCNQSTPKSACPLKTNQVHSICLLSLLGILLLTHRNLGGTLAPILLGDGVHNKGNVLFGRMISDGPDARCLGRSHTFPHPHQDRFPAKRTSVLVFIIHSRQY